MQPWSGHGAPARRMGAAMRVLVLQHEAFEGPAAIGDWLAGRQAEVTTLHLYRGDALPPHPDCDLLLIMGGAMSVNDEASLPWLVAEKRFVAAAMEKGTAVLGICLGAQLIASASGAAVYANSAKEIGWWPVVASDDDADSFHFPEQLTVFHWHGETFDLPPAARLLASSEACRHQAFQLGRRVIGLQFHLEMTPSAVALLAEHCASELAQGGRWVQSGEGLFAVPASYYAANRQCLQQLLDYLVAP